MVSQSCVLSVERQATSGDNAAHSRYSCKTSCHTSLDRYILIDVYTVMESTFGIIAEPNRRAILTLLASAEQSVSEIERQLRMPQPSVSKHLRVLREAGFVEARVEAQRRVYRIRPEPLMEVDAWLDPFRRFWTTPVDALGRHLDRPEQEPPKGRGR